MNDFNTLLDKLLSMFPLKALIGIFLVVIMDVRTVVSFAFAWLVFLDCFTRWLAITHDFLEGQGEAEPSLWQSFKAIPAARRAGLIRSEVMRKQGVDKLMLYILCALGAASCDLIFTELHSPAWLMSFVIGYMVVTELLSIVENLSDAGVSSMSRLITRLKGRL